MFRIRICITCLPLDMGTQTQAHLDQTCTSLVDACLDDISHRAFNALQPHHDLYCREMDTHRGSALDRSFQILNRFLQHRISQLVERSASVFAALLRRYGGVAQALQRRSAIPNVLSRQSGKGLAVVATTYDSAPSPGDAMSLSLADLSTSCEISLAPPLTVPILITDAGPTKDGAEQLSEDAASTLDQHCHSAASLVEHTVQTEGPAPNSHAFLYPLVPVVRRCRRGAVL